MGKNLLLRSHNLGCVWWWCAVGLFCSVLFSKTKPPKWHYAETWSSPQYPLPHPKPLVISLYFRDVCFPVSLML